MVLLSIPNTPKDITPQWLTEALSSTRTLPNVVVTSLRIEPIAELTCAGQLAHLHLSFSQPQSTLPRMKERQLLKIYHQTLKANGVDGYTFGACWNDYSLAMSRYFVQAVLMVASLNPENDRDNKLAQAVAKRFIAAITDLHLTEK